MRRKRRSAAEAARNRRSARVSGLVTRRAPFATKWVPLEMSCTTTRASARRFLRVMSPLPSEVGRSAGVYRSVGLRRNAPLATGTPNALFCETRENRPMIDSDLRHYLKAAQGDD